VFDRDEQEISQIIESGIAAILSGQATLEEVLAAHPAQADELRGELAGALWLVARQAEVAARPGFVSASRKRVLERIQAEADGQGVRRAFFGFAWPRRLAFQWLAAAVVVLVLVFGTGGAVSLAQSALPGEELYAVKRAAEQVAYTVTLDSVDRVALSTQFTDRRLEEANGLIAKGDYPSAESSLQDYEQGVHNTLALLKEVSYKPSHQVGEVAVTVKQHFTQNVQKLTVIAEKVPLDTQVKDHVQKAKNASLDGATAANNVAKQIQESSPAGPVAPTDTLPPPTATAVPNTSVPTQAPIPTATPVPPTPSHSKPPRPSATVSPSETLEPTSATTGTEMPTQAITNTPAPTTTSTTATPTDGPTDLPTAAQTAFPTAVPTSLPTATPTAVPTHPHRPTQTPTPDPTALATQMTATPPADTSTPSTPSPVLSGSPTQSVTQSAVPTGQSTSTSTAP
jgi:hypothetical protein